MPTGATGAQGENAEVVEDYEFSSSDVYGGSIIISGIKPIATVELYDDTGCGVSIERGDAAGNDKCMIKTCYPQDQTIIYFGTLDVTYGGRIRFAQGIGGVSPYQEWLNAGNTGSYAQWASAFEFHSNFALLERFGLDANGNLLFDNKIIQLGEESTPVVPEEPEEPETTTELMYYGYLSDLSDLSELSDLSDLSSATCEAVEKLSLGTGTRGQMLVVAIPSSSSLEATKFDGISSAVAFDETYGGANGEVVGNYKLYGEFLLVTGERFIYVQ